MITAKPLVSSDQFSFFFQYKAYFLPFVIWDIFLNQCPILKRDITFNSWMIKMLFGKIKAEV